MKSSARLTLTLTLACLLGAAALVPTAALAQMNYQGLLTDSSGNPLPDGQYTLEFRLFTLATSGAEVWGPYTTDGNATAGKGPRVDLVAGRFNAILSAADAAGRTLANALSGTRFLQIKVGTNPAITPRQQLLAAPKALLADRADTVADGAIGTAQLADLQITGAKIADNTIPVSKLTGAGANFWDGNATDVWRPAGNVGIGTVASAAK